MERLREALLPGAGADGFAELERLAGQAAPGSGGVLFTPWLNGERTPVDDHLVRGGLHNLSLDTTRAQLTRAVFEGVALNVRWMQHYVERFCRRRLDPVAFIGGGALSPLWGQVMADVLGRTVTRMEDPVNAGVRGAGLLGWLALGELEARRPARTRNGCGTARAEGRARRYLRSAVRRVSRPVQGEPAGHPLSCLSPRPRGGHSVSESLPPGDPLAEIEQSLKPYRDRFPTFERLPPEGRPRAEVLREIEAIADEERARWEDGYASGAVYHGDPEHIEFLNRVYALHSQSNPLHVDLWPSATKFEAEIVAMTASMLGADHADDEIVGTVSSGGSESIMLAMKAYRDRARARDSIKAPQMVLPTTAHAAFDKAARYFGIEAVRSAGGRRLPRRRGGDGRCDHRSHCRRGGLGAVLPARHSSTRSRSYRSSRASAGSASTPTRASAGSCCLSRSGSATTCRRSTFGSPASRRCRPTLTSSDMRPRARSVVLYRGEELRHAQYFTLTDWPGGLYMSPTFAGSRPGALSAACWAAMTSIGERGYLEAARRILETATTIKRGIEDTDGLRVLGDPLFCIAFATDADELEIYRVMDAMTARGWSLNGLHRPPAVHICTTLRHAQPGVAERFVEDLRAALAAVQEQEGTGSGMAPVYGAAATLPDRRVVGDMLAAFMDLWYRP